MDYTLEDTQNSAPGQPTLHEVSKLAGPSRKTDTQSVSKRSVAHSPYLVFNKSIQQNASALDCHMRHDFQEPLKLTSTKLLAQPPTRTPLPNDVDHPGYIRLP